MDVKKAIGKTGAELKGEGMLIGIKLGISTWVVQTTSSGEIT